MVFSTEDEASKFLLLYEKYKRLMYSICNSRLHNEELSHECVQETFMYIAENINKVGDADSEKALHYIAVIARGKAISMYRREVQREPLPLDESIDSGGTEQEEMVQNLELSLALDRLPEDIRNMVILKYYHGETSAAIGKLYGVSASLVRKHIRAALETMKKELTDNED